MFNANRVEYLVAGAYALAFYGHPRYTGDLDIFVRPTRANGEKIMSALAEFGFGDVGIGAGDFTMPDRIIQLGIAPNRLDLLTSLSGLDFDAAWGDRVPGMLEDVPVYFLSRDCLIVNKRATGRPQDLADVARLTD